MSLNTRCSTVLFGRRTAPQLLSRQRTLAKVAPPANIIAAGAKRCGEKSLLPAKSGADDPYSGGRTLGTVNPAAIGGVGAIDITVVGELPVVIVEQQLAADVTDVRHVEDRSGIDFAVARRRGGNGGRLPRRHILLDPEHTEAEARSDGHHGNGLARTATSARSGFRGARKSVHGTKPKQSILRYTIASRRARARIWHG